MVDNKNPRQDTWTLRDFALPQITKIDFLIKKLRIEVNNFDIKPAIL